MWRAFYLFWVGDLNNRTNYYKEKYCWQKGISMAADFIEKGLTGYDTCAVEESGDMKKKTGTRSAVHIPIFYAATAVIWK
jgi:hypothetical protein